MIKILALAFFSSIMSVIAGGAIQMFFPEIDIYSLDGRLRLSLWLSAILIGNIITLAIYYIQNNFIKMKNMLKTDWGFVVILSIFLVQVILFLITGKFDSLYLSTVVVLNTLAGIVIMISKKWYKNKNE